MATVQAIREALAATLDAVDGLRGYAYAPAQVAPPVAVVRRQQTRYDQTFDGADDHTMVITLLVSAASDRASQINLDAYVDPAGASSVAAAVHADPTLGGVVDFARVSAADGDRLIEYAGVEYLGCEFLVEVGD